MQTKGNDRSSQFSRPKRPASDMVSSHQGWRVYVPKDWTLDRSRQTTLSASDSPRLEALATQIRSGPAPSRPFELRPGVSVEWEVQPDDSIWIW